MPCQHIDQIAVEAKSKPVMPIRGAYNATRQSFAKNGPERPKTHLPAKERQRRIVLIYTLALENSVCKQRNPKCPRQMARGWNWVVRQDSGLSL